MEVLQFIIECLHENGNLPLSGILHFAATCTRFHKFISDKFWEKTLKDHFPTFYLHNCPQYIKRKPVNWKEEYKQAYHNMALRYQDGATLQQTKVIHFGPTLDKACIKELLNYSGRLHLPCRRNDERTCYEGKVLELSTKDKSLVFCNVTDGPIGTQSIPKATVAGNKLFAISDPYIFCYDMVTKAKLWENEIVMNRDSYSPIVAFENKVFFLEPESLICLDAATGKEMFRIPVYQRDDENNKKKIKRQTYIKEQIVFEGDFVVWIVIPELTSHKIIVANWKLQEIIHQYTLHPEQFDIPFEDCTLTRFAVSNEVMYVNILTDDCGSDAYCLALDLDFMNARQGISKVWVYNLGQGGIETESEVGPCVYGDFVYALTYYPVGSVVALDIESGKLVYGFTFEPGETNDVNQLIPVDLYVIEGIATIEERQKVKKARLEAIAEKQREKEEKKEKEKRDKEEQEKKEKAEKKEKGKKSKKNEEDEEDEASEESEESENNEEGEDEEMDDDEEEDEDDAEDDDEEDKDDVEKVHLSEEVENNVVTNLAVLRFGLQHELNTYFEGAIIAETGELLYFKANSTLVKARFSHPIAISKQTPVYLMLSQ